MEEIDLYCPPGKLGFHIKTYTNGMTRIQSIENTSVLSDKICVGDVFIKIDDKYIAVLPADKIMLLINDKEYNPVRKITVLRDTNKKSVSNDEKINCAVSRLKPKEDFTQNVSMCNVCNFKDTEGSFIQEEEKYSFMTEKRKQESFMHKKREKIYDDPSDMTYARRIALKLMNKKWYNPNANVISDGTESKELPSLESAWFYFEHFVLPRYIVNPGHDKHQKDIAQPGEDRFQTKLYSPIYTP